MRLGCFGKLPFYPDFLKVSGGDFASVDRWFQKGITLAMQRWGREWPTPFRTSPKYKFIFQDPESARALTGAFMPGEDRSGRVFPFSIYTESPKVPLKELGRTIEVAEAAFLNRVDEFFNMGWSGGDLPRFQESFRLWEAKEGACSPALFSKGCSMGEFWKESLGGFEDGVRYLIVKNLSDLLAPLKKVKPPKSFPGFRIPFNHDASSPSGVAYFWLTLIRALTGLDSLTLSTLWQYGGERRDHSYIYFFTGEPTPRSFIQLVDPEISGEGHPTDLSRIRADRSEELKKKMDPKIISLLDNGDIDLSSFLKSVGGSSSR